MKTKNSAAVGAYIYVTNLVKYYDALTMERKILPPHDAPSLTFPLTVGWALRARYMIVFSASR